MRALSCVLGACVVAGCAPADGPGSDDFNADPLDGYTVTGNIPDSVDIDQVLADLPAGGFALVGDGMSADVALIQSNDSDPLGRIASADFTSSAPSCPDCGAVCSPGSTRTINVTLTHNAGSASDSLGIQTVSANNFNGPVSTPSSWTQAIGTQQVISTAGTLTTCSPFSYTFDVTALDRLLVFASSTTTTGNIGGVAGGDSFCQVRANAANLGGTWMAWLSESATLNPAARFSNPGNLDYQLTDGTTIATDLADLETAPINAGITRDENGGSVSGSVWTGTTAKGLLTSGNQTTATCSKWSSNLATRTGTIGTLNKTTASWTSANTLTCSSSAHLLCFQQDGGT